MNLSSSVPPEWREARGHPATVLAFRGVFEQQLLVALQRSLDQRLAALQIDRELAETVHDVLVEQVQNIVQHGSPAKRSATAGVPPLPFCLVRQTDPENERSAGTFEISAGNPLATAQLRRMEVLVEELNGMTPEQLRNLFQKTGRSGRLREDNSSQLGLVQMARKSHAPLHVESHSIPEIPELDYFILSVQV